MYKLYIPKLKNIIEIKVQLIIIILQYILDKL